MWKLLRNIYTKKCETSQETPTQKNVKPLKNTYTKKCENS